MTTTAANIAFDAASHTYTFEGVVLPSVTQMLSETGLVDSSYHTFEAAERGTTVHQLCTADDLGHLEDFIRYDQDDLAGYLEGWRRFKNEMKPTFLGIEEVVYSDRFRYAGTLDRLATINGVLWLIDIKAGVPARWHAIQTMLYRMCLEAAKPVQRGCVYLGEGGRYKLARHEDEYEDYRIASAVIALTHWRRKP